MKDQPQHKALTVTFWQFEAQLSEHLTDGTLWGRRSEVFALYAAGYSVEPVAKEISGQEMQTL